MVFVKEHVRVPEPSGSTSVIGGHKPQLLEPPALLQYPDMHDASRLASEGKNGQGTNVLILVWT